MSPTTGALNVLATAAATAKTGGLNIPVQLGGLALKKGSERKTLRSIEDVIRQVQAGSKTALARPETAASRAVANSQHQEEVARLLAVAGITSASP